MRLGEGFGGSREDVVDELRAEALVAVGSERAHRMSVRADIVTNRLHSMSCERRRGRATGRPGETHARTPSVIT